MNEFIFNHYLVDVFMMDGKYGDPEGMMMDCKYDIFRYFSMIKGKVGFIYFQPISEGNIKHVKMDRHVFWMG